MSRWRALLLVYDKIDVRLRVGRWRRKRFLHQLSEDEMEEAKNSFRQFPLLVEDLTENRAAVEYAIIHVERPLTTVSPLGRWSYWPGPADTREELDRYAASAIESVFIFWPQNDFVSGASIPSGGWGLGMGASNETNGATYATVANAPADVWRRPQIGEVWLHEWLHGVCYHFAQLGCAMPDGDADGGDRHGYVQSPTTGWTDYYRDLMNGCVEEGGVRKGIPANAWLIGASRRAIAAS
jgi:hypothetical protein